MTMKRTLSFILALVMLIGLMPMQALATEVSYDPISTVWPSINADLTHIICYGQSFSTGSDAPYYDDPTVDNVYVYGNITNSSKGTELTHLTGSAGNQHPIISAGNVFAKLLTEAGIDTDVVLGSYGSGGKTIAQLDMRNAYGLNVLGIKNPDGKVHTMPGAQYTFKEHDHIIVFAHHEAAQKLLKKLQ